MLYLSIILQVVLAAGLINVWCFRCKKSTAFRGSDAKSLKEEFQTYGLPDWVFYVVGFLKMACAVGLLVGIWVPSLSVLSATVLCFLMIGAVVMHLKVKDEVVKYIPASAMLLMSGVVLLLNL